jgi:hypothetical protein
MKWLFLLPSLLLGAAVVQAQTLTTLYQFPAGAGAYPRGGLVFVQDGPELLTGKLYGTTEKGGSGTAFQIDTAADAFTSLASFGTPHGANPVGTLLLGEDDNFYGVTNKGGPDSLGSIYQLILNSVQVEINNPWPSADSFDFALVSSQAWQPRVQLRSHALHAFKDTVGEFLFAQFVPEVLLWVELGRISRQPVEEDIFRHHQGFGHM